MIKQNEQVITSDKNESYDHTHEIEMRPLRDKNKKLFNRMVSDTLVTNLVNSKYISSEEFVDRKFEVINDVLQRAYGAGCIMRPYREKGYAAIVLKLLGQYLKKEKGITRLALMVSSQNDAAIQLYKSAEFEPVEFIMHKFL
jgi:predicted acetyltransferase